MANPLTSGPGLRGVLLRGGLGSVVVKVVQILLTFGLTTVLARVCGAANYGVYVFAFAVIQLLSIPAEMGYQVLLVREVAAYEAQGRWSDLRGILRRSAQQVVVLSVVLGLLTVGVGWLFLRGTGGQSDGTLAALTAGAVLLPLLTMTNLRGAALRGFGRIVAGQVPGTVVRPGAFLLLVVLLEWGGDGRALAPDTAMWLHVAACAAALMTAWAILHHRLPSAVRETAPRFETRRWARASLSLTLIAGMQVVNSQTDILMLGLLKPPEMVGVYRVAVQCALVVGLGLQIVNMVVGPVMSRLHTEGDRARLQILARMSARIALAVAIPAAVLFAVWGETLLAWVFGLEFTSGLVPLYILAGGQVVNAAAGAVIMLLNMTGQEDVVVRGFIVSGVLNVALNAMLIPRWEMVGAAVATAVSLVVWNLFLTAASSRRLGISTWAFGGGSS